MDYSYLKFTEKYVTAGIIGGIGEKHVDFGRVIRQPTDYITRDERDNENKHPFFLISMSNRVVTLAEMVDDFHIN